MSGSIKHKLKYKRERFHMTSWLLSLKCSYVHVRNDRHKPLFSYALSCKRARSPNSRRQKTSNALQKSKKRKTTHCCYRRVCLAFHVTKNKRIEAQLILYNFIQFEIHGKQILIHKHPVLQGTGRRKCFKFTRMQSV